MNNEKEIVKEPKIEFYLILDYQIASELLVDQRVSERRLADIVELGVVVNGYSFWIKYNCQSVHSVVERVSSLQRREETRYQLSVSGIGLDRDRLPRMVTGEGKSYSATRDFVPDAVIAVLREMTTPLGISLDGEVEEKIKNNMVLEFWALNLDEYVRFDTDIRPADSCILELYCQNTQRPAHCIVQWSTNGMVEPFRRLWVNSSCIGYDDSWKLDVQRNGHPFILITLPPIIADNPDPLASQQDKPDVKSLSVDNSSIYCTASITTAELLIRDKVSTKIVIEFSIERGQTMPLLECGGLIFIHHSQLIIRTARRDIRRAVPLDSYSHIMNPGDLLTAFAEYIDVCGNGVTFPNGEALFGVLYAAYVEGNYYE